jgi:hypothetical protein
MVAILDAAIPNKGTYIDNCIRKKKESERVRGGANKIRYSITLL